MDIDEAINIISKCEGFGDKDTMSGQAWEAVLNKLEGLENEIEASHGQLDFLRKRYSISDRKNHVDDRIHDLIMLL